MRRILPVLCALVVAGCATKSGTPAARGKTKAEALAAYGKPQKVTVTEMGETWEYANVSVRDSKGALVKMKLLVISFDHGGKVMCWPCEFSVKE